MSIPKNMRKEAKKTNAFFSAYDLVRDLTRWLINDFGVGYRSTEYKVFVNGIGFNEEDEKKFKELQEKYHFKFENSFPQWLIEYYRDRILKDTEFIMHALSDAYYMYPQTMYQFNIRYQRFTDAINGLEYLRVILQEAIDVFPTNLEKYITYTREVEKEIEHVKQMRKNANQLKRICLQNDTTYIRQYGNIYQNPGWYYNAIFPNNQYMKGLNSIQIGAIRNFINGNYEITKTGEYGVTSNNLIPCCLITDGNGTITDFCV